MLAQLCVAGEGISNGRAGGDHSHLVSPEGLQAFSIGVHTKRCQLGHSNLSAVPCLLVSYNAWSPAGSEPRQSITVDPLSPCSRFALDKSRRNLLNYNKQYEFWLLSGPEGPEPALGSLGARCSVFREIHCHIDAAPASAAEMPPDGSRRAR